VLRVQFAFAHVAELDRVAAEHDRVFAGRDAVGDVAGAVEAVGDRGPDERVSVVEPLRGARGFE
jgi:hypothetical protein